MADEKIFSLFILEPGESGWGSEDEESYYIEQSFIHRLDATTAGSLYVAAYGTGVISGLYSG